MGSAISSYRSLKQINQPDLVILVVGSSGAGKTTFVNIAAGRNSSSITFFKPDALDVRQIVCQIPSGFGNRRVVFLDMPAFEPRSKDGSIPLGLRRWFRQASAKHLQIFGVLYLHRITDNRLAESMQYLTILKNLFIYSDQAFPDRVVLVTTMWRAIQSEQVALRREEELIRYLDMLPHDKVPLRILRFEDTFESAWSIVYDLLNSAEVPAHAKPSGELFSKTQPMEFAIPTSKRRSLVQLASDTSHSSESDNKVPLTLRSLKGQTEQSLTAAPRDTTKHFESLPLVQSPDITLPQPDSAIQSLDSVSPSADFSRRPNFRDQSRSLILKFKGHADQKGLMKGLAELAIGDAHCMIDFLYITLHEKGIFATDDRKFMLSLLCNLVETVQIIPRYYKLTGVQFDSEPVEEGIFADIHRGQYKNQKLCLKVIRLFRERDVAQLLRANIRRLTLWSHLSHPNILPFYGAFLYGSNTIRICLVSPWIDRGNLAHFLKNQPLYPRLPLIFDIVDGLLYLHNLEIVHGHLKLQNILVSEDGRALIADFEMSYAAMAAQLTPTSLPGGALRWKAPELFDARHMLTTLEADIWSFGCLCYEVFTRKIPFYQYTNEHMLIFAILQRQEIPTRPIPENECDKIDDYMWDILRSCWDYIPSKRPTIEEIRRAITDFQVPEDRPKGMAQVEDNYTFWEAMRTQSGYDVDYQRVHDILLKLQQTS